MMARTPYTRTLPRPLALGIATALALTMAGGIGCSTTGSDGGATGGSRYQELTEQDRELLRSAAGTRASAVEWRAVVMPDLLDWFSSDNPEKWRQSREALLADQRTPSRRMQDDGKVKYGYIVERLRADDWDSLVSREWLARQAEIYRQLARFNSEARGEWRAARERLVRIAKEEEAVPNPPAWAQNQQSAAERCAFDLMLRLLPASEDSADATSGHFKHQQPPEGVREAERLFKTEAPENANWADEHEAWANRNFSAGPTADRSLWASEELVEFATQHNGEYAERAVNILIWGSYMAFNMSGPGADRFQESIWRTLVQFGEVAVGGLLLDIDNAQKLTDRQFADVRVRRLLKAFGDIYGPDPFTNKRPDWQATSKHRPQVIAAIGKVMREFEPPFESGIYMIRGYSLEAFEKIGDPAAVPHLIWLWEQAASDGDDDFIGDVRSALMRITGERRTTLAQWRAYQVSANGR